MTAKSLYNDDSNVEQERDFTISILSENSVGMLHAITIIFTRRKVNIESINASDSEVAGVYRYTIVLRTKRSIAEKVLKQIEKLVDVLAAFLYEQDQVHYEELALYKVSKKLIAENPEIEQIVKNYNVKILPTEPEYEFTVYEKTGHKTEIINLFKELDVFGVSEFVKSARIAISKSKRETMTLIKYLEELDHNLIDN